jgi:hypothetical protein
MRAGSFGTQPSTGISIWKWLTAEMRRFPGKHGGRLLRQDDVEAIQLLDNGVLLRRLKRTKLFDLVP